MLSIIICAQMAQAAIEITPAEAHSALEELDDSLSKRRMFIDRRQARIDILNDSLSRDRSNSALLFDIATLYKAFNNDSALHYLARGAESAKGSGAVPFLLQQAELMPLSGQFTPALEIFDSISPDSLSKELSIMYYECRRQMFSYMSNFSNIRPALREQYARQALESQKQLLELLDPADPVYRYHLGEYYYETGRKGKARALLEEVFDDEPNQSNYRARAAHHLSGMARDRSDDNAYIYYLASAALADVSAATREVAALQELGSYLYTRKDVDRSYTYLNEALANAVECGAPLRMLESARSLPIIERAKTEQTAASRRTLNIILLIMGSILVALLIITWLLRREMKRMRQLQVRLSQANKTKEVYISQFLSLCSIYMDKLHQFCKIANRKISTGKVDDLYRLTKSGKFVEEQSSEFYGVFDNAFLHLYPRFPEQVNALLRADAQIELKEGELLNTDLRILAFMRLGIDESVRIAQVLNYSVNTIYAYRNRTKARAINRDTFEADIMAISGIS